VLIPTLTRTAERARSTVDRAPRSVSSSEDPRRTELDDRDALAPVGRLRKGIPYRCRFRGRKSLGQLRPLAAGQLAIPSTVFGSSAPPGDLTSDPEQSYQIGTLNWGSRPETTFRTPSTRHGVTECCGTSESQGWRPRMARWLDGQWSIVAGRLESHSSTSADVHGRVTELSRLRDSIVLQGDHLYEERDVGEVRITVTDDHSVDFHVVDLDRQGEGKRVMGADPKRPLLRCI
jgi:hypothetical protein